MLNALIALAVLAHGIGHVLFLAPTTRVAAWADQTGASWLMQPLVGDGIARVVGTVAWTAALGLFVLAAVGIYLDTDWWRLLAGIGAVVSLAAVIAFWGGIYTSSALLAAAFDIVVLLALAWTWIARIQPAGG
jgi:hypothetical protein